MMVLTGSHQNCHLRTTTQQSYYNFLWAPAGVARKLLRVREKRKGYGDGPPAGFRSRANESLEAKPAAGDK